MCSYIVVVTCGDGVVLQLQNPVSVLFAVMVTVLHSTPGLLVMVYFI